MLLGHGLDLVEVERIARLLNEHGERFAARVFTDDERAYCDARPARRVEHYAVRFAAKEAVLKALGTGLSGGIAWTDVEVTRDVSGAPGVRLHGRALDVARERGISRWHLSLTHTRTTAAASALAEG